MQKIHSQRGMINVPVFFKETNYSLSLLADLSILSATVKWIQGNIPAILKREYQRFCRAELK